MDETGGNSRSAADTPTLRGLLLLMLCHEPVENFLQ
jgi:hypothetical protein